MLTELNNDINSLVHDIEVPLDIYNSEADMEIYNLTKDEITKANSPEYLKFILAARRKRLYAQAVVPQHNGKSLFCLSNELYANFNFIEIAMALDLFPNLNSVEFTLNQFNENDSGTLTFTDDIHSALHTTISVSALGVRLRDWFDEKTVDEINRYIFTHNEKFNNAMNKETLILVNSTSTLLDACATVYSQMGKTTANSTMPLFDCIPKNMTETPIFVFTDYLER